LLVDFRPTERAAGAFQQSISADQAQAMCRRAFGDQALPVRVVELGLGAYNNTYRIDLDTDQTVILRVAPEPGQQTRAERSLMRNEYASAPYLAPVAALMPRMIMADFTHEVIGRDYLFQTLLDGIPAPDRLPDYPRPEWASFFAQLGTLHRRIHQVRGDSFGWVAGPRFSRWLDAYRNSLADVAAALDDAGLDAADIAETADMAGRQSGIFDEITQPRLLHGDLWNANVMVSPTAAVPTVTGICDCDRGSFGDPAADWGIFRASQRPGTERDAFWETYGPLPDTPAAARRARFYQILHLATLRLENHRSAGVTDDVRDSYATIRELIKQLH
jgi:aminoglycoside phosphotransferase (APT) family kinase protein